MVWSVEHVPTPHFFPYAPPDWVPGIYEGIKDIPQSTFVWGCIEWLESHGMLLLLATLSLMAISRCCLAIDEKDDDQPLGKKLATKSQLLSHMRQAPLIFVSLISTVFIYIYIYTGWWFQTFFTFHNIWDNPSHWRTHIFWRWLLHHQPVYMVLFSHRHWFFMLRDRSSGYLSEWPFWRPKGRRRSRRWRTP